MYGNSCRQKGTLVMNNEQASTDLDEFENLLQEVEGDSGDYISSYGNIFCEIGYFTRCTKM